MISSRLILFGEWTQQNGQHFDMPIGHERLVSNSKILKREPYKLQ